MSRMRQNLCMLFVICLLLATLSGCSWVNSTLSPSPAGTTPETPPGPTATPSPTPEPPLTVLSVQAVADPPVLAEDMSDPYSELNKNIVASMNPDRDQYNFLYRAVENRELKADVSSFGLSRIQMNNLIGCLDTGFRLFYLQDFTVRRDGKTVDFTYSGTEEEIKRDRETFQARLSHLLYDVAPEGYSSLQKFMAVYESVCEMSNYTDTPGDPNSGNPYSIVMKGKGICWGYAQLMDYVLNKLGIPAEYVCNEPHAWNVVQLNGKWYHSDATWGAGNSGDTVNNLYTMLMDDNERKQTLRDEGYTSDGIIQGYFRDGAPPPPACTDTGFSVYTQIGISYAFDIDHNRIYFAGDGGITRMNLDGSGREVIVKDVFPYQMTYFNGMLYYINLNDGFLYRTVPGETPELVDGSGPVLELKPDNAALTYKVLINEKEVDKSLPLVKLDAAELQAGGVEMLPPASIPRSRSFSFHVRFSQPADGTQDWNEKIFLVDGKGNPMPLYFALSQDGTELTVRSKACLADEASVTLFAKGVTPSEGTAQVNACRMDVTIQPGQ